MIRISFWQGIAANYFINMLRRLRSKRSSAIEVKSMPVRGRRRMNVVEPLAASPNPRAV